MPPVHRLASLCRLSGAAVKQPVSREGVAIVIPAYNHAHVLGEAIASVLRQSLQPSEIIIVDDGSRDQPERVAAQYPQVRLVRQANAGLAAARNRGMQETSSPYLLFLDADDRLTEQAIERGVESLRDNPSAAFTYCSYQIVDAKSGERVAVQFRPVPQSAFASFLLGNPIGMHGTVIYRRGMIEAAGGFREHLRACEDYDLYIRLARNHPVLCHPHLGAEYWQYGSNMSADPAFMLRSALSVLADYRQAAEDQGLLEDYRRGVRDWKAHDVSVWLGLVTRNQKVAAKTALPMMAMAPHHMARRAAGFLRRRLGWRWQRHGAG